MKLDNVLAKNEDPALNLSDNKVVRIVRKLVQLNGLDR